MVPAATLVRAHLHPHVPQVLTGLNEESGHDPTALQAGQLEQASKPRTGHWLARCLLGANFLIHDSCLLAVFLW